MQRRFDLTSVIVGCALAGALCFAVGATRSSDCADCGRFRLACTNLKCYLVDTMTGQVWNSNSGDFHTQKVKRIGYPAQRFAGEWQSDGSEREVTLVLEDDGRAAVLYDGTTLREGAWRAIHGHVFIEPVGYCLREKDADGELTLQRKSVGRQGDTVVTFRKVK